MSITINNTTISSRLTIIFDADLKKDFKTGEIISNDGPTFGTGNTESDVYIDDKVWLNIRSHTEIPSTVHALQCRNNNGNWSYELEYTNNDPNHSYNSQSELPSWVNNVVIRCEAQDVWRTAYDNAMAGDANAQANATTTADTARINYLSGNNIIY